MESREEKEKIKYSLKKILAAIKHLSIDDLADIQIMYDFGLDKLRKRKHPFVERLDKCFVQISKNVQGAEMVMTLLSDVLPKDITLLADHALTSKLNILLDITGIEIVNYELTSLALALATARIESTQHLNNHDELQKKIEKDFKEKIHGKNKKFKNLADVPFFFARERLEMFLVNVKNMNSVMYCDDEGNDLNEDIDNISSLFRRLDKIAKGPESEDKKLKKMEQTVVTIYWKERKTQSSLYDSRFANALETFLISPLGLNIPLKYGIDIPHQATKEKIDIAADATIGIAKPEDMLFLLTTKQEQDSFADKYKKLLTQLSPEHLKTHKRAAINQLISQIEEIKDEANIDSLKRKIAEAYVVVDKQAKKTFFGSSNLGTALEKFCKKEFNMDEQALEKLGAQQTRKFRIMREIKHS